MKDRACPSDYQPPLVGFAILILLFRYFTPAFGYSYFIRCVLEIWIMLCIFNLFFCKGYWYCYWYHGIGILVRYFLHEDMAWVWLVHRIIRPLFVHFLHQGMCPMLHYIALHYITLHNITPSYIKPHFLHQGMCPMLLHLPLGLAACRSDC